MGNRLKDVSEEQYTEHRYNPEIVSNATDYRGNVNKVHFTSVICQLSK